MREHYFFECIGIITTDKDRHLINLTYHLPAACMKMIFVFAERQRGFPNSLPLG